MYEFFTSASLHPRPRQVVAADFDLFSRCHLSIPLESRTNDNGLPQNTVRSIIQIRDGYLWLTTFDGLVRFDGVRFKVFNTNNTKGLTSNRFTALYEDQDSATLN